MGSTGASLSVTTVLKPSSDTTFSNALSAGLFSSCGGGGGAGGGGGGSRDRYRQGTSGREQSGRGGAEGVSGFAMLAFRFVRG